MELLRQESAAPIGAFGLFPTISKSRLLHYAPQLDFILANEFEETLGELLPLFKEKGAIPLLPGVVLRSGGFVPRPPIADLAQLPVPDDAGANCSYPTLNIAASRGCTGNCSFCFIRSYYGCKGRRIRDAISLELELAERLTRREIENLYFIDPIFVGHGETERERAMEIGRVAQGFGLPFGFETRVDSLDPGLLTALAKSGATSVFLGIESGCDSVLARIGKGIGIDRIRRGVHMVRESGMRLQLGFIMFEPDSTLAELEGNYAFLEEMELLVDHELTANLLYHNQIVLYGSTAWNRFEQEGRLLLDEHLPFEARYRFRDERVGLVCAAMGRLSTEYFRGIDTLCTAAGVSEKSCGSPFHGALPAGFDGAGVNELLKEAFQALCTAARKLPGSDVMALEESYLHQLRTLLPGKKVTDSD
jgi:radical SAM superfamily enzyme YgiQ (UPF0313 family)